jgi:hypothetical protein
VVQPASADLLYDIQTNQLANGTDIVTHEEFTEASFLTSTTTVSSFLLNTSTSGTVTSVVLDPVASGICPDNSSAGPCLDLNFTGAVTTQEEFAHLPTYDSVGTFVGPGGAVTITISQVSSVPEPSSLVLLATMRCAVGLAFKKRAQPDHSGRP